MSGWNNRVMHQTFKSAGGSEEWYQIHEVYYDKDGNIDGYTKDAIAPGGNTIDELRTELERMLKCLDKSVLEYQEDDSISPESPSS